MSRYGVYLGDMTRSRTESQGIITYARGLVENVSSQLSDGEALIVIGNDELNEELQLPVAEGVSVINLRASRNRLARVVRDRAQLDWAVRRLDLDVLHLPKGLGSIPNPGTCKIVVTMHDDIPIAFPIGRNGLEIAARRWYVSRSFARFFREATSVITTSHVMAHTFGRRFGVDPASIRVIYQGAAPASSPSGERLIENPYVLVLDSPHPHKNSDEAVEFSLRFVRERQLPWSVVVFGKLRKDGMDAWRDSVITVPGPVGSQVMVDLIAGAELLVSSSLYEGFGRPPLEALAVGVPAVVARTAVAMETLGDYEGVYAGGDFASFAQAAGRVGAWDRVAKNALAEAVRRRFSWVEFGSEVLDVYREVAES